MQLVDRAVVLPKLTSRLFVHNITDVHYEASGCDVQQFRKDLERIRAGNATDDVHLWLGGGDWNNGIGSKDKRFGVDSVRKEFHKYIANSLHARVARALAKEVADIAPYCIGYGRGNHEDSVIKYCDYDPAEEVARSINVPYLGYSAGVRLRLSCAERPNYGGVITIFWHHGKGSAGTPGGRLSMALSLAKVVDADVYMTGHVHDPVGKPLAYMTLSRRGSFRLESGKKLFINGGSYQKAYLTPTVVQGTDFNHDLDVEVDYAEKKAYSPALIGHYGFGARFTNKGAVRKWEVSFVD